MENKSVVVTVEFDGEKNSYECEGIALAGIITGGEGIAKMGIAQVMGAMSVAELLALKKIVDEELSMNLATQIASGKEQLINKCKTCGKESCAKRKDNNVPDLADLFLEALKAKGMI